MLDFVTVKVETRKDGTIVIYPDFKTHGFTDLVIRGSAFYAVWNEAKQIWSSEESDVFTQIDAMLYNKRIELLKSIGENANIQVESMEFYSKSRASSAYVRYKQMLLSSTSDYVEFDSVVSFASSTYDKQDHILKKLSYDLSNEPPDNYNELMKTLYDESERQKIEWAIGSIFRGDSSKIQKFFVFYGAPGSGKSTVLKIIEMLFEDYCTHFDAKSMTSHNNTFAMTPFADNPLVAVQHDTDLSKIQDNTILNSLVSHETITINQKYKSEYMIKPRALIFVGTNTPVKITNNKSGIIRRLIDIQPSGKVLPVNRYNAVCERIKYELGGIAKHCIDVYDSMGADFYNDYEPFSMMYMTDLFFNFVDEYSVIFEKEDGVSLKRAWEMYQAYCADSGIEYKMKKTEVREELKNYFEEFYQAKKVGNDFYRNYYSGFKSYKLNAKKFEKSIEVDEGKSQELVLDKTESNLDYILKDCPAQYASASGIPTKRWDDVTTKLSDLNTSRVHYVMLNDIHHIVIDFDLKDAEGNKSKERNLREAFKWPETYAEFSKSGEGVHLHYIYDGDPELLEPVYSEGIEVKVFKGKSALRRRLSYCNDLPIAVLSGGLPLKEKKGDEVLSITSLNDEAKIRAIINKALRKEIHKYTKPNVDFIYKILEDAYASGESYDVSDMHSRVMSFAMNSNHNAEYCFNLVKKMKFMSKDRERIESKDLEAPIVFFDVEVFPNLFLINWKYPGEDCPCTRMINPSPEDVGQLFNFRLIGFNNRRYDNHILYARFLGYTNEQLYRLSSKIVEGKDKNVFFGNAYSLSYTDVYDFLSSKKSLKKLEIELGIHHKELGLPWDQPVPEDRWIEVAEYCDNDVIATEAVFNHFEADWKTRQLLASLSGLSVNDTTNSHSTSIIFGKDMNPQKEFVYTDLSTMFPGYTFERGKSYYRGECPGEGGYVYAEPGYYEDVIVLDVASMHPTSIEQLNLFGDRYTKRFSELKQARLCIKHDDIEGAKKLLDGKLIPYLDEENRDGLAYALKIVINSIYGLTSAHFDNKCRDVRNKDNIVAKRGALFMIDLKNAVQEKGFTVAHIKTDSIKIPHPTEEIIQFVIEFGKKYGYEFEEEAHYSKMCLVNDAVYIAKDMYTGKWSPTGAQFAHPYVFKSLFSHDPIIFEDMCETKSVKTNMVLDMNEGKEDEHVYIFVGRVGSFVPVVEGAGGGILYRMQDESYYSVTGTKGFRWMESEQVKLLGLEDKIDVSYFEKLTKKAESTLSEFVDLAVLLG